MNWPEAFFYSVAVMSAAGGFVTFCYILARNS